MSRKNGLGRGLSALINTDTDDIKSFVETQKPGEKIVKIPLDKITPNPYQPRRDFDREELEGLALSIKKQGLLQPVVVRSVGDHYEMVAGERRLRAVQINGETEIASIIRAYTDVESMNLALLENLQRQNLNPMEVANAFGRLMREGGMTQEELSDKLGISRSAVANTVRLLNMPEDVQDMVAKGTLAASVARSISGLPNFTMMSDYAKRAVKENWSATQAEQEIRKQKDKPVERPKRPKLTIEVALSRNEILRGIHKELPHFVETLESTTGERVEVVTMQDKSKVLGFKFKTKEDLERIYQVVNEAFGSGQKVAGNKDTTKFSV